MTSWWAVQHDEENHLRILEEFFNCLRKHGFRLKLEKYDFLLGYIEYLGLPLSAKVEAIGNAPMPKNVLQLCSFQVSQFTIGNSFYNYYRKPLNSLLQTSKKWKWSPDCAEAFWEANQQIASARVLTHYYPSKPITLAADASSYEIGSISRAPNCFCFTHTDSRRVLLCSTGKRSSNINLRTLEWKNFIAMSISMEDHYEITMSISMKDHSNHWQQTTYNHFRAKEGQQAATSLLPFLAATRLQNWTIILSAYDYNACYKSTAEHRNTDGLSRLPLPTTTPSTNKMGDCQ